MKKITLFFAALALAFSAGATVDVPASAGAYLVLFEDGVLITTGENPEGYTTNQEGGYASITDNFVIGAAGANDKVTEVDATHGYATFKLRKTASNFNPDYQIGLGTDASNQKHKWSEWAAIEGSSIPSEPGTEWQYAIFKLDAAIFGNVPSWFRIFIEAGAAGVLEIEDIYISVDKPDYSVEPPVAVDKTALDALIATVDAGLSNYGGLTALELLATTNQVAAAFLEKYNAAKEVSDDEDATQAQVTTATSELAAAAEALQSLLPDTAVAGVYGDATVAGTEYYSITGAKLSAEPVSGVYIVKTVYSNGKVKSVKTVK
jgi:hypothetical protein